VSESTTDRLVSLALWGGLGALVSVAIFRASPWLGAAVGATIAEATW